MRSILTLALATATCSLFAQLQNGGFEDLNALNMPSFWTTGLDSFTMGDSIVVDSATYLLNSTDVHSGQYAVELRNSYNYTQDHGSAGRWFASPFEEAYQGFPSPDVQVVERPERVTFWAKYQPVQGDTGYAEVSVYNEFMDEIGFGAQRIGDAVSSYTLFEMPIAYSSVDSAVFIHLRFTTAAPGQNPHLGTRMMVDDVNVVDIAAGVRDHAPATFSLFPNPAADHVRVSGLNGAPLITVTDATGRVQMQERAHGGSLAVDRLVPGAYTVRAVVDGRSAQQRLLIAR